MGNTSTSPKGTNPATNLNEKEMVHPQLHRKTLESLLTLEELQEMCLKLEENVQKVSVMIDSVIFEETPTPSDSSKVRSSSLNKPRKVATTVYFGDEDEEETVETSDNSTEGLLEPTGIESESDEQIEVKFIGMTRVIQNLIHELTEQLDHHSIHSPGVLGDYTNSLTNCVISLVNNVNNYMAVLIKNIRKIGRLLSEGDPSMSGVNQRLKRDNRILEVIRVTQDIDAMLVELRGTEKQREEMERDVVDVMLICKHFRSLQKAQEECLGSIDANVKLAALSIDMGHRRMVKKSK